MKLIIVSPGEEDLFSEFLPKERRAELMRLPFPARVRSAAAEAAVRLELGGILHIPPGCVQILRTAQGKPYVQHGPHFSVSHTDGLCVCAVDAHPVGVDAERAVLRDFSRLARPFSEEEQTLVKRDPLCAFYRLWTAKESVLKLLGEGISKLGGLSVSNRVIFRGKPLPLAVRHFGRDGGPLPENSPQEGEYLLALCTHISDMAPPQVVKFHAEELAARLRKF